VNPDEQDRLLWGLFLALMGCSFLALCVGMGTLFLALLVAVVMGGVG